MTTSPLRSSIFCAILGALPVVAVAQEQGPEPAPAPAIRNGELTAEELADFLGIGAWVFEYEGGRPRCWLEVEEVGQKTVSKPKVLEVAEPNKRPEARRGKVLFFLRRGDLQLRIHSGASRGGSGLALPPDALWWGWPAFRGSTTRLERPAAPKPGEEVVLLRYETEEATEGVEKPRKVVLTLRLALDPD